MPRKTHPLLIVAATVFVLFLAGLLAFRLLPEGMRGRRLLHALANGRTNTARVLVLLGTDPNFQTGHGSAMHYAAATGDIDLLRFLVLNGARVDEPGEAGVTPLYLARMNGHENVARFLLARGAEPNLSKIRPQP